MADRPSEPLVREEFYPQKPQMTADGEWEFPRVGKNELKSSKHWKKIFTIEAQRIVELREMEAI